MTIVIRTNGAWTRFLFFQSGTLIKPGYLTIHRLNGDGCQKAFYGSALVNNYIVREVESGEGVYDILGKINHSVAKKSKQAQLGVPHLEIQVELH